VQQARLDRRQALIQQVTELAGLVIFGSLSEIYRTCGTPGCRCHRAGPKHGPHLQVVYRGENGKSSGYYVPIAAQDHIRKGAAAWRAIQEAIRDLAAINKDEILERARSEKMTRRPKSSRAPIKKRPSRSRLDPPRS
jgi:hypothetical protein